MKEHVAASLEVIWKKKKKFLDRFDTRFFFVVYVVLETRG